jgi:hypothetical protein
MMAEISLSPLKKPITKTSHPAVVVTLSDTANGEAYQQGFRDGSQQGYSKAYEEMRRDKEMFKRMKSTFDALPMD